MLLRRIFATLGLFLASASAVAASTVTYFHNDLTGSPVAATNEAGAVIWREGYRPFGERLQAPATDNQVWFTSRRQDPETGLVYMGARYYEPVAGRFLSPDPVHFVEGNIHSFNRYAYANNNPYRFKDPSGSYAEEVFGAVSLTTSINAFRKEQSATNGLTLLADIVLTAIPGIPAFAGAAVHGSQAATAALSASNKVDAVIAETFSGSGNILSSSRLSANELLEAGQKFLGTGYKELGKDGSGVFRSADGTRQFRIDSGSLSGSHAPGVPHGHFEVFSAGATKPKVNNHVPFKN
jgi:RHS repeat-associated protein